MNPEWNEGVPNIIIKEESTVVKSHVEQEEKLVEEDYVTEETNILTKDRRRVTKDKQEGKEFKEITNPGLDPIKLLNYDKDGIKDGEVTMVMIVGNTENKISSKIDLTNNDTFIQETDLVATGGAEPMEMNPGTSTESQEDQIEEVQFQLAVMDQVSRDHKSTKGRSIKDHKSNEILNEIPNKKPKPSCSPITHWVCNSNYQEKLSGSRQNIKFEDGGELRVDEEYPMGILEGREGQDSEPAKRRSINLMGDLGFIHGQDPVSQESKIKKRRRTIPQKKTKEIHVNYNPKDSFFSPLTKILKNSNRNNEAKPEDELEEDKIKIEKKIREKKHEAL